ncbi:hypothetical protein T440DRAFT_433530 [Plenodomus tracheiphilus IPT5]|uniref:ABM domain-containing protein n=1 Tax=Plenodomus tracheiphilus IPT5 TaxID=1408161 RepID=A0A6A7ASH2_9PLEO|nr:hypothetical protein T440DRAFT_433530 [Plenodomus tracheiphilus IPT5]
MSGRLVEVASVPVKAGLDLSVGEAKTAWDYAVDTIAKQSGLRSLYWGFQVEHPDVIQMIAEWDSLASHQAFMASPDYRPLADSLQENILANPPSFFHVDLAPNRGTIDPFTQPLTECALVYFPANYPSAAYEARYIEFEDIVNTIPNVRLKGTLGGWSQEPTTHEKLGEDVKGRLFVMFVGWDDLAAHQDFLKAEYYKPAVVPLRDGMIAAEMVHIPLKQVK